MRMYMFVKQLVLSHQNRKERAGHLLALHDANPKTPTKVFNPVPAKNRDTR